jgi:hypothetical protein
LEFKIKDIVTVSGYGRTETWEKDLEGTVCQVDEANDHVFVIWHGTCVEDQMRPEELNKIGVNAEIPDAGYLLVKKEKVIIH